MINFDQPLTAGTVLVREQVQSQNFVQGSTGWVIRQDGSAEFNDVVIRGGTVVSGTALYYDGTPALGNLIMSIAAAAGIDQFGNAYLQGATSYGPDGSINLLENDLIAQADNGSTAELTVGGASGAELALRPQDVVGATYLPGGIRTALGASNRGGLTISSPAEDSNTAKASMDFYGGGPSTNDTSILAAADRFNVNGQFEASNIQSGSFQITPTVANEWTANTAVAFDEEFATTPVVMLTCTAGAPGSATTTELEMAAASVTTTGFNARIRRGNLTATTLSYLAISTL